jgi:GDP-L-fucose synthase
LNILVLGKNSFIAREIYKYFHKNNNKKFNFTFIDRTTLDVSSKHEVDLFFDNHNNQFDFIINTCVVGGTRDKIDTFSDFTKNIEIFNNLLANSNRYKKLINFCSGAAFDRTQDIKNFKEEQIFSSYPKDFYGLAKNIIAREAFKVNNIINLRVFGCFGVEENDNRFIKSCIKSIKNKENITIFQNKQMDYIYSEDLCKIIEFYLENASEMQKDINAVYNKKYYLYDIAKMILFLTKTNSNINIIDTTIGNSYTGSSQKIDRLNIDFYGLEKGIERTINELF